MEMSNVSTEQYSSHSLLDIIRFIIRLIRQ